MLHCVSPELEPSLFPTVLLKRPETTRSIVSNDHATLVVDPVNNPVRQVRAQCSTRPFNRSGTDSETVKKGQHQESVFVTQKSKIKIGCHGEVSQ